MSYHENDIKVTLAAIETTYLLSLSPFSVLTFQAGFFLLTNWFLPRSSNHELLQLSINVNLYIYLYVSGH